jgi:twinkle protein
MRKGSDENEQVGKFSIRGAGEIADLADKVFVVFRNKQREKALALRALKKPHDEKFIDQPDVFLKLVKNRQDGTELDFGLYFHKDSMQFTSREGRAMPLEGTVDDY